MINELINFFNEWALITVRDYVHPEPQTWQPMPGWFTDLLPKDYVSPVKFEETK